MKKLKRKVINKKLKESAVDNFINTLCLKLKIKEKEIRKQMHEAEKKLKTAILIPCYKKNKHYNTMILNKQQYLISIKNKHSKSEIYNNFIFAYFKILQNQKNLILDERNFFDFLNFDKVIENFEKNIELIDIKILLPIQQYLEEYIKIDAMDRQFLNTKNSHYEKHGYMIMYLFKEILQLDSENSHDLNLIS